MEKLLVSLVLMAAGVLAAWVGFTWAAWRLLRWSRQRPEHRPGLGLALAAGLGALCVGMILFRWSFSYSKTVNGVGTHINVQLGWLFLLPLGLVLAAAVLWVKALRTKPPPTPQSTAVPRDQISPPRLDGSG